MKLLIETIYGNAFARAPEESVKGAVTIIDPPTITNIIAMEAPKGGYGQYPCLYFLWR